MSEQEWMLEGRGLCSPERVVLMAVSLSVLECNESGLRKERTDRLSIPFFFLICERMKNLFSRRQRIGWDCSWICRGMFWWNHWELVNRNIQFTLCSQLHFRLTWTNTVLSFIWLKDYFPAAVGPHVIFSSSCYVTQWHFITDCSLRADQIMLQAVLFFA